MRGVQQTGIAVAKRGLERFVTAMTGNQTLPETIAGVHPNQQSKPRGGYH